MSSYRIEPNENDTNGYGEEDPTSPCRRADAVEGIDNQDSRDDHGRGELVHVHRVSVLSSRRRVVGVQREEEHHGTLQGTSISFLQRKV